VKSFVGRPSPVATVMRGFASVRALVSAPLWHRPPLHGLLGSHAAALAASLAMIAAATLILLALRDFLTVVHFVTLVYLIPVVAAATLWGTAPAILAAIAGALSADFFFYEPLYTLWISDSQDLADLAVFLVAAVVTGNLATRLKLEADSLRGREKEIRDLYEFSRELAACFTVSDLITAIQTHLSQALGRRAFLLEVQDIDAASSGRRAIPEPVRLEAVAMLASGSSKTQAIADPATGSAWVIRVLAFDCAKYAVIAELGTLTGDGADGARRHFDAVIEDAAATLVRLEVARAIAEARARLQSDALRDALIGTVSHELRSPLVSILGSTSVLDQAKVIKEDARIRSLVGAVHEQASRLDDDIRNLLSAARMTARGVRPQFEWSDPADIVDAAIAQKTARLAAHRLDIDLAPDLPLIRVDSAFVEQALAQLLENAAKYSPPGSEIAISAYAEPAHLVLAVADRGCGLAEDEVRQIGRRAFRGTRHMNVTPGSGLGLWLASTFVGATGGTLEAASPGPGLGTTISVRFPIARDRGAESELAAGAIGDGRR
jgi:K+-sensing histidine kinase KdpD